jgi:lycopene cyclase domain-containing protein
MSSFLYLILNIFSISYPLFKTTDKRIRMFENQRIIWLSIFSVALLFIIWDSVFTIMNIWGFNSRYLTGLTLLNLPIEEVLFFFCVPYACLFIYEVTRYYDKMNRFEKYGRKINGFVIGCVLILIGFGYSNWYTSLTGILLLLLLLYHQFISDTNKSYLGQFYLAFFFITIPFLLINSILTGSFIPEEVVWYNSNEIIGFRIGTIPIEDLFYCLLLMLSVVTVYEKRMTLNNFNKNVV